MEIKLDKGYNPEGKVNVVGRGTMLLVDLDHNGLPKVSTELSAALMHKNITVEGTIYTVTGIEAFWSNIHSSPKVALRVKIAL